MADLFENKYLAQLDEADVSLIGNHYADCGRGDYYLP